MELSRADKTAFLETLWEYYAQKGRTALPWRLPEADGRFNPYHIMVSELMLQQTQVSRVILKYQAFLEEFPAIGDLAAADLGDVLRAWQGLGYNRRAKFLWQAAQAVRAGGSFPDTLATLTELPGIGTGTAGAILAYAYNRPVAFVETNVRTVYIHHFFQDRTDVHDREIIDLVTQTVDREQPREFYWALMDYGTHLKATVGNLNKASRHYAQQSAFPGSRRQIRGQVIKLLGSERLSLAALRQHIDDPRLEAVLGELADEGMIRQSRSGDGAYHL